MRGKTDSQKSKNQNPDPRGKIEDPERRKEREQRTGTKEAAKTWSRAFSQRNLQNLCQPRSRKKWTGKFFRTRDGAFQDTFRPGLRTLLRMSGQRREMFP